jgi:hypothetical protein
MGRVAGAEMEDAFLNGYKGELGSVRYSEEVAEEMARYANQCFFFWAKLGPYSPLAPTCNNRPATKLHPAFKALAEEQARSEFEQWRAGRAKLPPIASKPLGQLPPVAIDRANPGVFNLGRTRLLNFKPSAYFGQLVRWQAPAEFNCNAFMNHLGLSDLAPFTQRIRLTTDGKINVLAASSLWFQIFGAEYSWDNLATPLRVNNLTRPQEIHDPELLKFLEVLA